MQGSKKAPLPGSLSNESSGFMAATQRRMQMYSPFGTSCRRRRIVPGLVPRPGIIRAALSSPNPSGASSGSASVMGLRNEGGKPEPTNNAATRRTTRTLYKVSDDPLLRQTQMLLEASRRLREQTVPMPIVDQQGYYGCSSLPGGGHQDLEGGREAGQRPGASRSELQLYEGNGAASSMQLVQEIPDSVVVSFGALAAASATAAARMSAARSAASSQTTGTSDSLPLATSTASGPTPSAATAGHAALTAAATTASIAAAASVMPPAASASGGASLSTAAASAASAAATAASSGWLAIEELLEEAAYSLSQELVDTQGPSPMEALMASTSGGSTGGFGSPGAVLGMDLPEQLPESLIAPLSVSLTGLGLGSTGSGSTAGSGSLVAAVPGGDKLSEMLEGMLYSLSQDINLGATQEAVLSAATAAAAGLAGAAAELPRAAFSVYRSAAEAAAAAAAARAAAALGPTSGGSGGTALVVPDESQSVQQASFDDQYDAGEEYDAAELGDIEDVEVGSGNPAWDPYGTIRTTEGFPAVPDYSAAAAAAAVADPSGDTLASAASAAVAAASDGAAAVLPPIVTASAAPSLADAATATAVAVVEAATTAAAGTILITPPPPSSAPPFISSAPVAAAAAAAEAVSSGASANNVAGLGAAASSNATATPSQAASVPPQPAVTQSPALNGDSAMYGTDTYELNAEDIQRLDELTAALQNLLEGGSEELPSIVDDLSSGLGTASSGTADAAAATAAAAAASSPALLLDDPSLSAAEATMSSLAEALRRELGAVVANATDAVDADPAALAQSAGQAVRSALDSLSLEQQINLSAMPQDLRLSTLLGATVQSALDLVESALNGIRSADSTLVGGLTIAVVLAVLIRSLVSMAAAALNRGRVAPAGGSAGTGGGAGSGSESAARLRPVGVTALEAAAALNNDPQALLLDIRNDSDLREQGLPDLRPFRRGTGATTVPLPYCDFRTTPTLANPSGSLLAGSWSRGKAGGNQSSSTALAPVAGTVVVSVDPLFCSKFKQFEGLNRDSRVFLMDSYGVEAPEAVLLLRSDPEIERLLGAQGVTYIEGGFAGPEGWKLTGLPVADAPGLASEGALNEAGALGLGLDLSGLLSGVARLRLRYPSLFARTLAVCAVGGAGLSVASSLDWGAVSRGAVGLAAAMLLTDRALPPGMRPSSRIRQYLQSRLSETQLGGGSSGAADLTARRNRTALLLRVLDLAEGVGDAVIRAGGTAITVAGNVARDAMAVRNSTTDDAVMPTPKPGADDINVGAELETPPSPSTGASATATIVLPHGMDLPRWSEAAEMAVAQRPPPSSSSLSSSSSSQQEGPPATATAPSPPGKQTRSVSPLRPNWRVGSYTPADSSSPSLSAATAAATAVAAGPDTNAAATAASGSGLLPPRSLSPSLAGRLSDALHNAASAIVRAASPSRAANGNSAATTRAGSPGIGTSRPDTLELMAALATASALSNVDSGLLPGWPASSFPKASAGQASTTASKDEEQADDGELEVGQAPIAGEPRSRVAEEEMFREQLGGSSLQLFSSLSASSRPSDQMEAEAGEAAGDLWSNWRQELEAVAPPPPTLLSEDADGTLDDGIREAGSSRGDNADRNLYGSGSASLAASRLDLTSSSWRWGVSPSEGADHTAGATSAPVGSSNSRSDTEDGIHRQQNRKVLRTSSPERAAAAGAALRRMRLQMDDLDDDGLASAAYGTGELYGSGGSGGALGKRSGSGSMAVARMAPGRGGLSRGLAAGIQQQELSSPSGAEGRQKQPLRTASPQRAAEAAAAMRQLRAELGLPPNDGRDADAVVPRDWRREMDAAAAGGLGSFSESDSELEPAERFSLQGGGNSNTGNRVYPVTGDRAAARLSPSPRNWRAQLEGRDHPEGSNSSAGADWGRHRSNGGVPADWRLQIEAANGSSNVNTQGHDSSDENGFLAQPLRTTNSPGRAKLTAAERAARDARLHDWRARV
ncbi:hypothetical protein Vafri_7691 [Volvox africanus]|uniref:Rhodanese domain-containing protein n=1 Tax=Volvox africanus TaxID=51714 RepID=A0A8J4B0T7_9CHLO|nr:hypothetical protein Vafri_7691 [Volvox africanus]